MYSTSLSYAKDDMKPDIVLFIFEKEGNVPHNLTGSTLIKFYMRNMETGVLKLNGVTTGNVLTDAANGKITRTIQTGDNDTVGRYLAWFSYTIASGVETTTPFELVVENAWERSFR